MNSQFLLVLLVLSTMPHKLRMKNIGIEPVCLDLVVYTNVDNRIDKCGTTFFNNVHDDCMIVCRYNDV